MTQRGKTKGLVREFAFAVASYLLRGRWFIAGGHRPPAGHRIPEGFAGVGVAASADPRGDDYIMARLDEAGLRHVRLDFSYGDAEGPAGRLLEALLARSFKVMLHLVQPFAAAKAMDEAVAQEAWRHFVATTLDRFGSRVELVEICSTVNRKRWAGYSLSGFLAMWSIAHTEVRARGLTLAGPSVTDFEPPFNVGLLSILRRRGLLPDIHTDNLFSERCTEPERFDHKILGRRLANVIRINLVRKARMLQRIGADAGVPRLMSPAAFWTLPRIERVLPDSEQKQADYLSRYMVLCAASGALERAWWGPLVCHREGLIDDGVPGYPALERITHYAGIGGDVDRFRVRPALAALATFARWIPGTTYEGRQNDSRDLEVHAFRSGAHLIHVAWTINGRAAALADLYDEPDLREAGFCSRDGLATAMTPTVVGESPLYLHWPATRQVRLRAGADLLKGVAVHWHVPGRQHVFFRDADWQGLLLATGEAEARCLLDGLHPDRIGQPPAGSVLRNARNVIWKIADPRGGESPLVAKKPVRIPFHKRLLDRHKPSKGLRSWSGTSELLRRGVAAAPPVAYIESRDRSDPAANYFICEHVAAECTARELVASYGPGLTRAVDVSEAAAWSQLSEFLLRMHGRGIHFRDLSGGNILLRQEGGGRLSFSLIDTGRLRAHDFPLSLGKRISDLVRVCNKMDSVGRARFLRLYMQGIGRNFRRIFLLPFLFYDIKVVAKRRMGRKAIKRLIGGKGR